MHICIHVAQSVAFVPGGNVVVVPDERRDDGLKIANLDGEDEDDSRKLACPVQKLERHEANQVCNDGKGHSTDKVRGQAGCGEWRRGVSIYIDEGSSTVHRHIGHVGDFGEESIWTKGRGGNHDGMIWV